MASHIHLIGCFGYVNKIIYILERPRIVPARASYPNLFTARFVFIRGHTLLSSHSLSVMLKHYYTPLFVLVLTAFFLSACTSTRSTTQIANDESEIIRICREQVDAWRAQSLAYEAKVWAQVPYAMKMLTNGTRTVGWQAINDQYKVSFGESGAVRGEPEFSTALSDFHVHVKENSAWVVFHQHQIFDNEAGEQEIYATLEMRCLERIDDQWQIVFQLTGPYSE